MNGFLDSLAVEFEGTGLTRQDVIETVLPILPSDISNVIRVNRDASTEMYVRYKGNIPLVEGNSLVRSFNGKADTFGYELNIPPVNRIAAQRIIFSLLPALQMKGEIESDRCSSHIHVGFQASLQMLKNALITGLFVDPILFKLSIARTHFRGKINNSIYARPLFMGPTVNADDGNHYRLLNYNHALDAKDVPEFWESFAYAQIGDRENVPRYHPGRYFAINLWSIPLHGTVEFRHWNQSLNPAYLWNMVQLCQAIAELFVYINPEDDGIKDVEIVNPTADYPDAFYIERMMYLVRLVEKRNQTYKLSKSLVDSLMGYLCEFPNLDFKLVDAYTHVKDFKMSHWLAEKAQFEMVKRPVKSGYLDIHHFEKGKVDFSILNGE